MTPVLLPVCEPSDAGWAASQAIALYGAQPVRLHVINVQRPLPQHVAQFFKGSELRDFHREAGMRVLEPVIRLLNQAGIPHEDHVLVGHQAETIVEFAKAHGCAQVLVEPRPQTVLSKFGLGSISSQVMHLMRARTSESAASQAPGTT
jgi:nucleotide-binding universal stress UspA family protein